jgi:hypothetical protein
MLPAQPSVYEVFTLLCDLLTFKSFKYMVQTTMVYSLIRNSLPSSLFNLAPKKIKKDQKKTLERVRFALELFTLSPASFTAREQFLKKIKIFFLPSFGTSQSAGNPLCYPRNPVYTRRLRCCVIY